MRKSARNRGERRAERDVTERKSYLSKPSHIGEYTFDGKTLFEGLPMWELREACV